MNIAILLTEALQTSYPPVHLAYAMQQRLMLSLIESTASMLIGRNYIIVVKVWPAALTGTTLVPGTGLRIFRLPKKVPWKLFSVVPFGRIAECMQFIHMSAPYALDVI